MSSIHWKPMTGGRQIPSELPCVTVEMVDGREGIFYKYQHLNKQAFIVKRWRSVYPPYDTMEGLPVLWRYARQKP